MARVRSTGTKEITAADQWTNWLGPFGDKYVFTVTGAGTAVVTAQRRVKGETDVIEYTIENGKATTIEDPAFVEYRVGVKSGATGTFPVRVTLDSMAQE